MTYICGATGIKCCECMPCCSNRVDNTGYFTKEEAKQYRASIEKLYKPIGVNIFGKEKNEEIAILHKAIAILHEAIDQIHLLEDILDIDEK